MGYVKEQLAAVTRRCEKDKIAIRKFVPVFDAATKIAKFWTKRTGERVTCSRGMVGHTTIWLDMGHIMPNGRHPSMGKDVSALIEYADEMLVGLDDFDKFRKNRDETSVDLHWDCGITIYVLYGGHCVRVPVGVETVTVTKYVERCY